MNYDAALLRQLDVEGFVHYIPNRAYNWENPATSRGHGGTCAYLVLIYFIFIRKHL
jgi:hypothetical protein